MSDDFSARVLSPEQAARLALTIKDLGNREGRCRDCAHTIDAHSYNYPGECLVMICDCHMWVEGTGDERPR